MSMSLMKSSRTKFRTACPACRLKGKDRSGDNLIVYEDDGAHCFSCHYHENPPETIENMKSKVVPITKPSIHISLPDDTTSAIPFEPLQWLMAHKITIEEITRNDIMWSPRLQFLIFPFYDSDGNLVFWNARNFDKSGSKYHTVGPRKDYCIQLLKDWKNKTLTSEVVICEDVLSAIKISRHMDCFPMIGSDLSYKQIVHLAKNYHRIVVWGDRDKLADNTKLRSNLSQYFNYGAGLVISRKDPKVYSDEQIYKFLEQQKGGQL